MIFGSIPESMGKCWTCEMFDRLFVLVSNAAGAAYSKFIPIAILVFICALAFHVLYIVMKNLQDRNPEAFMQKSLRPLAVKSLFALGILLMGVSVPRLMTDLTFSPISKITVVYSEAVLATSEHEINEKVDYAPTEYDAEKEGGFYSATVRNNVLQIMKTTITQFQNIMSLGLLVMDKSFSFKAILGFGNLAKHLILFAIGWYLFYGFFKMFIKFCFYFVDLLVNMTLFAFFFPISLALFPFRDKTAVKWLQDFGKNIGAGRFNSVVSSIVSLGAAIITYMVIILMAGKYFSDPGTGMEDLIASVQSGDLFLGGIDLQSVREMRLGGCVVTMYVLMHISDQIPKVSQMILSAFGVGEAKNELGETVGGDLTTIAEGQYENMKTRMGSRIDTEIGDHAKATADPKSASSKAVDSAAGKTAATGGK